MQERFVFRVGVLLYWSVWSTGGPHRRAPAVLLNHGLPSGMHFGVAVAGGFGSSVCTLQPHTTHQGFAAAAGALHLLPYGTTPEASSLLTPCLFPGHIFSTVVTVS